MRMEQLDNQTPELCIEALKQDIKARKYIKLID